MNEVHLAGTNFIRTKQCGRFVKEFCEFSNRINVKPNGYGRKVWHAHVFGHSLTQGCHIEGSFLMCMLLRHQHFASGRSFQYLSFGVCAIGGLWRICQDLKATAQRFSGIHLIGRSMRRWLGGIPHRKPAYPDYPYAWF